MLKTILGKKLGQTQRFAAEGRRLPVTLIEAGPCSVVQLKTTEKDGYWAVQLGFGVKKIKDDNRGAKQERAPLFLKEVRVKNQELEIKDQIKTGDIIKVEDVFAVGDKIEVVGTSKGKGFAGVVKRWGFKGGPRTHGQSDRERAPGSIGSTPTPGRVYKGKKMAGRMGQEKVTVKGLKVLEVEPKKNLLVVKGLVPGSIGSLLLIEKE